MLLRDKVIKYLLEKRGCVELVGRSRKYRVFENESSVLDGMKYFVGKNGSCRKGRSASNSQSISSLIHKRIADGENTLVLSENMVVIPLDDEDIFS